MYYIFDNGGKTLDRYTMINKNGDIFGFSENPSVGFGQYSHTLGDRTGDTTIKEYLHEAFNNTEWLGKRIKVKDLPKDAQRFVRDRQ